MFHKGTSSYAGETSGWGPAGVGLSSEDVEFDDLWEPLWDPEEEKVIGDEPCFDDLLKMPMWREFKGFSKAV